MPTGIYKHKPLSEEHKKNISLANKGKIPKNLDILHSKESRYKASLKNKGKIPKNCWLNGFKKGHKYYPCKEENLARKKEKIGKAHLGIKASEETKLKLSISHKLSKKQRRGETYWNWKGGISKFRDKIRAKPEWKAWRKAVFERDNYTCQICKKKGYYLNAHHIIPVSVDKTKIYEISNGLTLCKSCHFNKELGLHKNILKGGNY